LIMLSPLAATSNAPMIRRLGGANWRRLHRLVYAAAVAAALHFLLLVKSWPAEPLIYAGIIAALLLFRGLGWLLRRTRPGRRRAAEPLRV
jgi:methionine sulfoxide reductase heme-binding subunit